MVICVLQWIVACISSAQHVSIVTSVVKRPNSGTLVECASFCLSSGSENITMCQAISRLISCVWSIPLPIPAETSVGTICGSSVVLTEARWSTGMHGCAPLSVCVTESSAVSTEFFNLSPSLTITNIALWSIQCASCGMKTQLLHQRQGSRRARSMLPADPSK